MVFRLSRWLKIALLNLLIVATIGVILRYKILYPLPVVDQRNLLFGHYHFAFTGWLSQAIMTLLIAYLVRQTNENVYKRYQWLLFANLVTAYGMLIAFPLEGYGLFSITLSTLSILVSYVFAFFYWRDLNSIHTANPSHLWFKAGVLLNAVSSLGAFSLTIMMVTKNMHQNWYLASQYFYLHFQYNGWFFFSCMGLFMELLSRLEIPIQSLKKIFWLFAFAVVPAYFLSALWMTLPAWVYILVVISALAQVTSWVWLVKLLKARWPILIKEFSVPVKTLLGLSALALSVKLFLQLGSTIPSLSTLAFGFRPIVIGYLHLVLLGVISLFLLGYMFNQKELNPNKQTIRGGFVFATGVILNEMLLMIQGVGAIYYTAIPFINEMLLGTALIIFGGIGLIFFSKRNVFS